MYRIRYASRLVQSSQGPEVVAGEIVPAARVKETFSRYDNLDDAYRQAVNDLYHGKIVLGIENEETGDVEINAETLHIGVATATEQIRRMEADDFPSKLARQLVMRGLGR
jgi:hypothetical protein